MAAPPQQRPDRAQNTERDARIYTLRLRGMTERQIAAHVKLSPTRVHEILAAAYAARTEPLAEQLRAEAVDRLDDIRRSAHAVRSSVHWVVQNGRIVKDDEGTPLVDHGPVLAANLQLLKTEERAAKMFGLDSPVALEIAMDARADLTVNAITAVVERLGLPPEQRAYALEAAAAALEGTDPPPPPVTEQASEQTTSTPVVTTAHGVRYVVINGQRYEHAGAAPIPPPIVDADVISEAVDDPSPAAQDTGDAPVPDPGPEPRADGTGPNGGAPKDDTRGWPVELRNRNGVYGRRIG